FSSAPTPPTPPPFPYTPLFRSTRRSLIHHRDFLKLWSAATISLFGSQVSTIAIPTIAILTLGATTFEASLLFFFEMLPFILFTRSEEHTSELQSRFDLVCRLLL